MKRYREKQGFEMLFLLIARKISIIQGIVPLSAFAVGRFVA